MSTATAPMYEWKDLPWHQIERKVFKLQKRIYQATLGAHDMSLLAEEPDAGKPARPVLKPSGGGDPGA
jgi:hypothetical protein